MVAKIASATLLGLETVPVEVEVDLSNALPGLTIVGLPDKSVDEARERVRSAIRASGATVPAQRITVNLAPADLRKEGPAFDLPIAIGILAATGQIPPAPAGSLFVGELSLGGEVKPIRGMLAIAGGTSGDSLFAPAGSSAEATLAGGPTVYPVPRLQALIDHLKGERLLRPATAPKNEPPAAEPDYDFGQIRGQAIAKRALEIAAAGGHNVLLTGPPGTGKTILAKALPGILPSLSRPEALEVSTIYSVTGLLRGDHPLLTTRPFRSPHHSISLAGLIGGGSWPRPGELTLAHRGVLFLDEIPQFPSHVLEAMRGPLEDRVVRISRAQHALEFPTDCVLVASENPCPCGYADDPGRACQCTPAAIERYRQRLSGPLRDRFDLTIAVPQLPYETLVSGDGESSATVRDRVTVARERQAARFGSPSRTNAGMGLKELEQWAGLEPSAEQLLGRAVDHWRLSVRGYHRVIKVARTIADLGGRERITEPDLAEALQYRQATAAAAG